MFTLQFVSPVYYVAFLRRIKRVGARVSQTVILCLKGLMTGPKGPANNEAYIFKLTFFFLSVFLFLFLERSDVRKHLRRKNFLNSGRPAAPVSSYCQPSSRSLYSSASKMKRRRLVLMIRPQVVINYVQNFFILR